VTLMAWLVVMYAGTTSDQLFAVMGSIYEEIERLNFSFSLHSAKGRIVCTATLLSVLTDMPMGNDLLSVKQFGPSTKRGCRFDAFCLTVSRCSLSTLADE